MHEHEAANRFRRLIEPLHDRVLAFSRSLCRSTSDGDDLFQEAMLRAYTKLDALRDDATFRGWVYRIVITVHRSRARRAFWRRLIPFSDHDHEHADDDVSAHGDGYRTSGWTPDAVEANLRARRALAKLPVAQREAIVLFEIEGWEIEEIAELHRVSISAIKSRLSRGRAHLRELYDATAALASAPTLIPGDTP